MKAKFHIPEPFEKDFTAAVGVSSEGMFTTTLPAETAQLFLEHEVHLATNRLKNPGFFSSETLKGLKEEIQEKITELCSEEEASREQIIRYSIDTACAYAMPEDGDGFLPNCVRQDLVDDVGWRHGTVTRHASRRGPYGFWMYAKPFEKVVYRYTSTGRERVVYKELGTHLYSGDPRQNALEWLAGLSSNDPPRRMLEGGGKVQEVPCTVENLLFFRNLFESIFALNEKIKPCLDPKSIQKLAQGGMPLLGS